MKIIEKVINMQEAVKLRVKPKSVLTELTTNTGVSGPCPLMRLPYFDPIRDCVIDMMHTGTYPSGS
jgi:hypothetical protein